MENHVRAKIKVLPIFVGPIAVPATAASTLIFSCIYASMIHSIATVNEQNPISWTNRCPKAMTVHPYSLCKLNLLDCREHWTALPDTHMVSDSWRKYLNLELDKCMDAATMPITPLELLSGIQMVAFPLRQHNRRVIEPVTSDDRCARSCRLAETNFYSVCNRCHLNVPLFRSALVFFAASPGTPTVHDLDSHVREGCAPMCPGHCPTLSTGISSCVFVFVSCGREITPVISKDWLSLEWGGNWSIFRFMPKMLANSFHITANIQSFQMHIAHKTSKNI